MSIQITLPGILMAPLMSYPKAIARVRDSDPQRHQKTLPTYTVPMASILRRTRSGNCRIEEESLQSEGHAIDYIVFSAATGNDRGHEIDNIFVSFDRLNELRAQKARV